MIHQVYDPYLQARLGTAPHFCRVVVLKIYSVAGVASKELDVPPVHFWLLMKGSYSTVWIEAVSEMWRGGARWHCMRGSEAASERKGNNFKCFKDIHLKANRVSGVEFECAGRDPGTFLVSHEVPSVGYSRSPFIVRGVAKRHIRHVA